MVDGVADQVVVDAVLVVAEKPVPTAILAAVLEGRHHHLEPVTVSSPGVSHVLEGQKVGLGLDGPHARGRVLTRNAGLINDELTKKKVIE